MATNETLYAVRLIDEHGSIKFPVKLIQQQRATRPEKWGATWRNAFNHAHPEQIRIYVGDRKEIHTASILRDLVNKGGDMVDGFTIVSDNQEDPIQIGGRIIPGNHAGNWLITITVNELAEASR